jgi:hypothetical protein
MACIESYRLDGWCWKWDICKSPLRGILCWRGEERIGLETCPYEGRENDRVIQATYVVRMKSSD